MMQWKKLLSPARLGQSQSRAAATREPQRSPFQRDYDRIIFCGAFRRLQDKTQVFPLAQGDYVRTRLTHSLEAACVGRSLGTQIGRFILERKDFRVGRRLFPSDIGDIVAAAALAHDIGNPPFGHSGEHALQHWFAHSEVAKTFLHPALSRAQQADFLAFEGNAQGLRTLTRLQMPDNHGGLQLTCATLGAFAKYPRPSWPPRAKSDRRVSTKKFSFFQSEKELFAEVARECGLLARRGGAGGGGWCRHPLAFVVEAADDICYRLIDFEDGMRLGHLSYEEVSEAFSAVIGERKYLKTANENMRTPEARAEFLRAVAIGRVIEQIVDAFFSHEKEILAGEFERPLLDCAPCAVAMRAIEERSIPALYNTPRGIEIEAAGFEVIGGLMDLFVEAVESHAAARARGAKPAPRWQKLLCLLPEPFVGPRREPAPDAYTRLLRVSDYVCGMTDSFAVGLYKKLRGISLPGQASAF